jgi:cyclic pyranopterin phosphate synthase
MMETPFQLTDARKRRLNYLRISVTDRCNLRCMYCMPRGGVPKLPHGDILSYEEVLRLAKIATGLGIDKIRITGGEPLVRKGIIDFLSRIASVSGVKDLALTTNGVLLEENLDRLRAAGLRRINVSLDSLRPDRYAGITGRDCFDQVWRAIRTAPEKGFHPVRINMVVMRGVNDDEVVDFARLSLLYPYHVRFIEYMPIGTSDLKGSLRHIPSSEIKERVARLGNLLPVPKDMYDGPAERFRLEGAPGEIGLISAMSHHFCHACNRLRLTARGRLRPCLLSDHELDVVTPLRSGASDEELAGIFLEAALNKPGAHGLQPSSSPEVSGHMWSIGG